VWHSARTTQETDGFELRRIGHKNVNCTIHLWLDNQPQQFKLDRRLAYLLGVPKQTRPAIILALWQYIKTHKLQDRHEQELVNCDHFLRQIFQTERMKFAEIPQRLNPLLHPPDPITINHTVDLEGMPEPYRKRTLCYDIDVEIDNCTLKTQMNSFLSSTMASQQEIAHLDNRIYDIIDNINARKTNWDFFLGFSNNPQLFINKWLISQSRGKFNTVDNVALLMLPDLKTMTDIVGNPEEERHADFYYQPWAQEAVCRYFHQKIQQQRAELE